MISQLYGVDSNKQDKCLKSRFKNNLGRIYIVFWKYKTKITVKCLNQDIFSLKKKEKNKGYVVLIIHYLE